MRLTNRPADARETCWERHHAPAPRRDIRTKTTDPNQCANGRIDLKQRTILLGGADHDRRYNPIKIDGHRQEALGRRGHCGDDQVAGMEKGCCWALRQVRAVAGAFRRPTIGGQNS